MYKTMKLTVVVKYSRLSLPYMATMFTKLTRLTCRFLLALLTTVVACCHIHLTAKQN